MSKGCKIWLYLSLVLNVASMIIGVATGGLSSGIGAYICTILTIVMIVLVLFCKWWTGLYGMFLLVNRTSIV